ncbi:MAG: hypothetical protein H7A21_14465 [Spirochaetales bacterium]|nr:hypothetical protein [Leptospiraceae bacterium]MCP5482636.1 hypothetical protein [Spirochaetales bacterium]MCP5485017.1 hypothetical protein [Spirochaetales bacterium]
MKRSLSTAAGFVAFLFWAGPIAAQTATLQGDIRNGTRGGTPATVEELALISLDGGMQVLATQRNVGPSFRFDNVPAQRNGPLLLRARFQGDSYATMIPPTPDALEGVVHVTVFESGASRADVRITAALQVAKLPDEQLAVRKLFAVANVSDPPRSFDAGDYAIYVPDEALELRASLVHESTRMPLNVELRNLGDGRYLLDRTLRPGDSELTIEYTIDAQDFEDFMPLERERTTPDPHSFTIVIWRPADARPEVSGGEVILENIPDFGEAYRVVYRPGEPVHYDFEGGSVLVLNPLDAEFNPIFDHPGKTVLGLFVVLGLFFFLISIVRASGLRIVRRS